MAETLESTIREEAIRLGFACTGFAAVAPSESLDVYRQWLTDGFAADMTYLERHAPLKEDPRRLAADARSVVAVGARYATPHTPAGSIATHARGRDYHEVLREKLRRLATTIDTARPGTHSRVCVDSAPLLEREWAMRAGLGWQGKQGQLVNPRVGCCLVLGFLLTEATLAPSPPMPNRCGTCSLCVDACPTGAALGDARVDARRCISYLTIEHKGDIDASLRNRLGGSLFGCDRCTAVCPWNRFGEERVMPELQGDGDTPTAETVLTMDDEAFAARFGGTALERTGLACLQRNARLAGMRSPRG